MGFGTRGILTQLQGALRAQPLALGPLTQSLKAQLRSSVLSQ